ncbi:hypothetical protein L1887_57920 [Cichorium endivia]|nr:hypothetical protein L1887_57920 [Cichorium endivia]
MRLEPAFGLASRCKRACDRAAAAAAEEKLKAWRCGGGTAQAVESHGARWLRTVLVGILEPCEANFHGKSQELISFFFLPAQQRITENWQRPMRQCRGGTAKKGKRLEGAACSCRCRCFSAAAGWGLDLRNSALFFESFSFSFFFSRTVAGEGSFSPSDHLVAAAAARWRTSSSPPLTLTIQLKLAQARSIAPSPCIACISRAGHHRHILCAYPVVHAQLLPSPPSLPLVLAPVLWLWLAAPHAFIDTSAPLAPSAFDSPTLDPRPSTLAARLPRSSRHQHPFPSPQRGLLTSCRRHAYSPFRFQYTSSRSALTGYTPPPAASIRARPPWHRLQRKTNNAHPLALSPQRPPLALSC